MYYEETDNGFKIKIKVTPNSRKNEIIGIVDVGDGEEALKINIHAQPEDGKANKEIINFLSKYFAISKSSIQILSGQTSKFKLIYIEEKSINLPNYNN